MSKKRFIIIKSIYDYYALVDKERKDTKQILLLSLHKEQLDNVADLLNELYEENNQLRKDKAQLKERLRESNMRLDRFNCR